MRRPSLPDGPGPAEPAGPSGSGSSPAFCSDWEVRAGRSGEDRGKVVDWQMQQVIAQYSAPFSTAAIRSGRIEWILRRQAERGRIGDVDPTSEEGWMNSIIYLVGLVVVVLAVLSFFGLR